MRLITLLLVISLTSCGGKEKEEPIVEITWEQKLSTVVENKLSVDNNKVVLAE